MPFVMLGEQGRGRKFTPIAISPDAVKADFVRIALSRTNRPKILASDASTPEAALVRMSCSGAYIRNADGRNIPLAGRFMVVARGHGAFGIAGRVGDWDDDLVVAWPGTIFVRKPSRGAPGILIVKDDCSIITYDSIEEYEAAVDVCEDIPFVDPTQWRDYKSLIQFEIGKQYEMLQPVLK
ncbi:hypothetical protein D6783_02005 [Candidatus Woesearchaeota archaeon]|nr:MAG: hypothetical protein D6783_02005 [Candidatus Woesearchaeota archaeon]